MRPSVSAIRLPACTSPWKKPCRIMHWNQARIPARSFSSPSTFDGAQLLDVVDAVAEEALHDEDALRRQPARRRAARRPALPVLRP